MNFTLITGASKGIGRALAEEFARHNCNLLLTARSGPELIALAESLGKEYNIHVKVFPLDLLKEGAVKELYNFCQENNLKIRVVVNNAGFGLWGKFAEIGLEKQLNMMQLNQNVLVEMCYAFLPHLKDLPNAHILNVASTAAFQPLPGFSVYAASKSFVYSFSHSLRNEFSAFDINVSCLCPGPTETEFFSQANFDHKLNETEGIKMPVEEVARKAVSGMLAGRAAIIPGISNKLGVLFGKHLPAGFTSYLLGKLLNYKKKGS